MKTSRVCSLVALTLAMFGATDASADVANPGGTTIVLNTYSKVWINGDTKGPEKIGKNTGAGTMDAAFAWCEACYAANNAVVPLATVYTRSDSQANGNGSYMQCGVAFAQLTDKGVVPGAEIDLPRLQGERAFMRPIMGFLPGGRALVIAASEDNGVNNNPQPVAFVVNTAGGQAPVLRIPNSTRGNNVNKPTNIIRTAVDQNGIQVDDDTNQRGPHTITRVNENTFLVGMQYNNQAQEAFSISVAADNTVKVNWVERYSDTAQHSRPQVAYQAGAKSFFITAVEANTQPANIGARLTEADVATGKAINSNIFIKSDPKAKKHVSEPVLSLVGDKLAVSYGMSTQLRPKTNGHGNTAAAIHNVVLVDKTTLKVIGQPIVGVGAYGRHGGSFATTWGPEGIPALNVIAGSSTGTGPGMSQVFPLQPDGTLAPKDQNKVYQVSPFSDVANVQARGKRNPNDQARGFINGLGNVPNPGFTVDPAKAATSFMPEVKSFSFSTVTGYSTPEALGKGIKNSVWLALVPAVWQPGINTVPGKPTDKPGTNPDGTGPAPRTTGDGTGGGDSVIPDDETSPGKTRAFDSGADSGCAVGGGVGRDGSGLGLIGIAVAAGLIVARKKREEV